MWLPKFLDRDRDGRLDPPTPWKAKTTRLGVLLIAAGSGLWAIADVGSLLERLSPALIRLGMSLTVAFVIGWLFGKAKRLALVLLAVAIGVAFVLQQLGLLKDPAVEDQIRDTASAAMREVERWKDVAMGYVPSGAAGAVGLFNGFRSRPRDRD